MIVRPADFDYPLPPELIAQFPAKQRDQSRLLVVDRASGQFAHRAFAEFPGFLRSGDVLVLNDSRVIPARLRGRNHQTGGRFELLLLEENGPNEWWAMLKPGKRARIGTRIDLTERDEPVSSIHATVEGANDEGHRRLKFHGTANILGELDRLGEVPLPPYIRRESPGSLQIDADRYQTVFANDKGSLAAPTAGLHFTPSLLEGLHAMGVITVRLTLHVGLGTFAPVKAESLEQHTMHEERYSVPDSTAEVINLAKADRRRVIAVGTTSLRVLESVARLHDGRLISGNGRTKIFIHPPSAFSMVDVLLTNFHLPRSTLLMLVSAFAAPEATTGRELILRAYDEAIRNRYRFFSYGDAMLIL